MSSMMQRRQSLGVVSGSSLNSRSSMGRQSLGGSLKTSASTYRKSMGGAEQLPRRSSNISRKSSAVGRPALDPRPLGGREYVAEALDKLAEYLLNNGYNYPMPNFSTSYRPTGPDFKNLATFLIKQLDPNWECGAKFDDEFLAFLKTMGYPYIYSKTTLSSVGSPNSWAKVLGSLEWIVDLLNYDIDATACGGQKMGEFDSSSDIKREGDEMFNDFLKSGYASFLAGDDAQYEEYTAQFSEFMAEQNDSVSKVLNVKEQQQKQLKEAIQAELQHGEQLPKLREKLGKNQADFEKLSVYIEQLKDHNKNLNIKIDAKRDEVANEQAKIEQVRETIKSLKSKISAQELSADEALRMVTEKDRLEKKLKETTAFAQKMKHKEWEAETELNRKCEDLQHIVHEYTGKVSEMQLLPPGSANAQGVDFRIEINKEKIHTATSHKDALSTDVSNKIVPALNKYKEMIANQTNSLRNSTIMLQDQEEQSQECLEELSTKLENMQARHAKLEDKLNRQKEQLEAILSEKNAEHEEIEKAIDLLQDNPVEKERRRAQTSRKLGELKSSLELQRQAHSLELERLETKIMDAISTLTDSQSNQSRLIAEANEYFDQKIANIQHLPNMLM